MKPKLTIIFDLGDVLLKDKTKSLEAKVDFDRLPYAIKKRYVEDFHASETGKIPTSQLLKTIRQTLVPNWTERQIKDYLIHTKLLPPWKIALKLNKLGYRILIFSNNQRYWPKKFSKALKVNLQVFPFLNSSLIGLRKPHLNYFKYGLKKFKVSPKECLFIDDRKKNLAAAKKLGITTFHYQQNSRELLKFLKKQGISGI